MDFTLEVQKRDSRGKAETNRLRKNGIAPAVIYSKGLPPYHISFEVKDFVHLAEKAKTSQVFTLKSDDSEMGTNQAIVKDIQVNGQNGTVMHVDFQLLNEKETVAVIVPLSVFGEAPGVKNEGGILTTQCRQITVIALPKDIPSEMEVSVSELKLGERIRTGDVVLPEGVVLKSNPEETVANVLSGRSAKLAEEEEAAAAAAAVVAGAEPAAAA